MPMLMNQFKQFSRFLVVGVGNTLLCFAIMYLGARNHLEYPLYTALGYIVAMSFSFFMNLIYTFRVRGQLLKRFSLFFSVNLSNLVIVEILQLAMIEWLGFKPVPAILLGMTWYVLSGYYLSHRYIYNKPKEIIL